MRTPITGPVLEVLTERFPGARLFALDGIADQLRARGTARLDAFRPIYGDKLAMKVTVPTETITEGPATDRRRHL